ncbi:hypothetical protein Hanom_Chr02g00145051 [Helianthus anomalus]
MHLNQLASSPTPIFFRGWIYCLFKTYVQHMPKSFHRGARSGKVDLAQCRLVGIIQDDPNRPPPQHQSYHVGSSSQGGGFPNFQSLTDLLQENLLCTRYTYNMASIAYTRIGAVGTFCRYYAG